MHGHGMSKRGDKSIPVQSREILAVLCCAGHNGQNY